jgi:hypothetical protein
MPEWAHELQKKKSQKTEKRKKGEEENLYQAARTNIMSKLKDSKWHCGEQPDSQQQHQPNCNTRTTTTTTRKAPIHLPHPARA